jgi:fructokinase
VDVVSLGELIIDMFPAETGKPLAGVSSFIPKPGGAPANVAVAAARLGASAAFIGKVGQDFFGEFLREVLARERVETRGMRFDPAARTTLAFIAQPGENNTYLFYRNPGADQLLSADELDRELIGSARALHLGSISLTDEPARSATFEAIRIAVANRALISLDVNYRPALWRSPQDALAQIAVLLPQVDLVKVNESELELLSGETDVEKASELLAARGPKLVVVTLGARGSYFHSARTRGYVPGFQVQAIDSTGCGDAFMGALLTQLVRHVSEPLEAQLQAALRYANAAGALTATRRGAIPAMPTTEQLQSFLKKVLPKIGVLGTDGTA